MHTLSFTQALGWVVFYLLRIGENYRRLKHAGDLRYDAVLNKFL